MNVNINKMCKIKTVLVEPETTVLLIRICLSIYGSTILVDLGRFFSFLIHTVGRTLWTGDQSLARPLRTHGTTQTQKKRTQTSIPRVGFEPTIPAFEQAKTVHALDRAATVIFKPNTKVKVSKDIAVTSHGGS
jgi:hypothetical protein